MNIEDLLIDFDEMGFAPTTICPNPDEYACEWKMKLIAEIDRQQAEIERLKAFKACFDKLYGKGIDIANWHLKPFDSFYESALQEMVVEGNV